KAKKERLTDAEQTLLNEWLSQDAKNLELYNKLLSEDYPRKMKGMLTKNTGAHYRKITKTTRIRKMVRSFSYGSVLAAASVAMYFLFTPLVSEQQDDNITPEEGESDLITLRTGGV